MRSFNTTKEAFNAGYALPIYSISRTELHVRHLDREFKMPIGTELEQIVIGGTSVNAIKMEAMNG